MKGVPVVCLRHETVRQQQSQHLISLWDKVWLSLSLLNWIEMCLQTQPVPNPMSYYLHRSPWWFHRFETLSNHFVELIAPFFTFLGRRLCMVNGAIQILFQVALWKTSQHNQRFFPPCFLFVYFFKLYIVPTLFCGFCFFYHSFLACRWSWSSAGTWVSSTGWPLFLVWPASTTHL